MQIGCKSSNHNPTVVCKSIEKSDKYLELALKSDDINMILSFCSDDCILSTIGVNDVTGRNDIEKFSNVVLKNQKINSYKLKMKN